MMLNVRYYDSRDTRGGGDGFSGKKPLNDKQLLTIRSLEFSINEFFESHGYAEKAYSNIIGFGRKMGNEHPEVASKIIDSLKICWASFSVNFVYSMEMSQDKKEITDVINSMPEGEAKTFIKSKFESAQKELVEFTGAVNAADVAKMKAYITNHTDLDIPAAQWMFKTLHQEEFADILPDPRVKAPIIKIGAALLSSPDVKVGSFVSLEPMGKPNYGRILEILQKAENNNHPHIDVMVKMFCNCLTVEAERTWAHKESGIVMKKETILMTITDVYKQHYNRSPRLGDLRRELETLIDNQRNQ